MVNVTRNTRDRKVERVVVDIVKEPVIQIELSEYEAKVLNTILWRVGGNPEDSPRVVASDLERKLNELVGQPASTLNTFSNRTDGLMFANKTKEAFLREYDGE